MTELILCERCSHLDIEHRHGSGYCHACDCEEFTPEPEILGDAG